LEINRLARDDAVDLYGAARCLGSKRSGTEIPGWILPAPSAIIAAARDWAPDLLYNSYVTLRETVLGFLLAFALSLPLAVIIAFTVTLRRLIYPILLGLQSVPKVALAPLVILWLGIGSWPKIVIVVLVCFFPILVMSWPDSRPYLRPCWT